MKKGRKLLDKRKYDGAILADLRLFGCATPWQLIAAHVPDFETGFYVLRRMAREKLSETEKPVLRSSLLVPESGTRSRRVLTLTDSDVKPDWSRLQLYELVFTSRKLGWEFKVARPFPLLLKAGEPDMPIVVGLKDDTAEQVLAKVKAAGAERVGFSDPNVERANQVFHQARELGIRLSSAPHFMARRHPRPFRQAPL